MELNTTYLSIGSNLGNKSQNISNAIQLIEEKIGPVTCISKLYETAALGFETDELFINCCITVQTKLSPIDLLIENQEIEKKIGRVKTKKGEYESRKIDIDIILYENEIIISEKLTLPHPRFRERYFVLFPLADIAPNILDPISQLSISQLKKNSPDSSWINQIHLNFHKKG